MKLKSLRWMCTVLVLAICAGASTLNAQVAGGTFTGVVRDASGAVVPGANITITNVATGVKLTYETSNEGVYFAPALLPGDYTITAEKEGFKREVYGPVKLEVAQTVGVDLALAVGTTTQTVEVKATGAQLVQTETAEISQVVGSEAVAQLPLNGRNYLELMMVNSGVTPGSPGDTGCSPCINVEGSRTTGTLFLLDGLPISPSVDGRSGPMVNTSLEEVQEFSLEENSYSAEYGDVNGAIVNLQTRGGTNHFHGSAYEYFRNQDLDASDFFSNATGLPKNALRFNQFGGSVGGPIKRDKSFFFFDYEGSRTSSATPLITTVLSPANRTGDFSSGSPPIFDPTSNLGAFGARGLAVAVQLQRGGQRDSAHRDQLRVSRDGGGLAPANLPGVVNNYAKNVSSLSRGDELDVRIDHNFSPKSALFAHYTYNLGDALVPSIFGAPLEGGGGQNQHGFSDFIGFGYTYTFRPNLLNEFRLGFYYENSIVKQLDYGTNSAAQFGMPNVNTQGILTSGMPNIIITSGTTLGDPIVTPLIDLSRMGALSDKLNWVLGRHTLSFGGDYNRQKINLNLVILSRGLYEFEPTMTSSILDLVQGIPSGNAVASFLTGYPTVFLRDTIGHPIEGFPQYDMYVQDSFKVTSRLTLNYGLHYDIFPPSIEEHNHQTNFDPATGAMLLAGVDSPYGRRLKMTDYHDFAPRLGLAYRLTSDGKTVLRSGYSTGYMDTMGSVGAANGAEFNPPFYNRVTTEQFPLAVPSYAITDLFPPLVTPNPATPSGDIRYLPPHDRDPYVQSWNFGIQRAITNTMLAEVAYVGTHGVHLLAPVDINQGPPGPNEANEMPYGSALGEIWTIQYAGSSDYNGLEAKIQKRWGQGLWFLASYTASKSMDNNSEGTNGDSASGNLAQNPNDLKAEWARSTFDVPQRFVYSGVWQLPYGHGRHFGNDAAKPLDWILGGWQLSGIYTAQSGTFITASMLSTDINADSNCNCRPDEVANPNLPKSQRTIAQWFNTAAFAIPSTNRYGNAGRDTIQAPGLQNIDLGIDKYFRWGKEAAKRIQFRAEMFNAFNHVNFGIPNNSIDSGPAFGAITGSAAAREIQFALRFEF